MTIGRGETVIAVLGSANRDERQFACPDELDIAREPNRHLSFGQGVHYCVGAALSRMEGQIAIGTLVRRFPDLRSAACWSAAAPARRGLTRPGVPAARDKTPSRRRSVPCVASTAESSPARGCKGRSRSRRPKSAERFSTEPRRIAVPSAVHGVLVNFLRSNRRRIVSIVRASLNVLCAPGDQRNGDAPKNSGDFFYRV